MITTRQPRVTKMDMDGPDVGTASTDSMTGSAIFFIIFVPVFTNDVLKLFATFAIFEAVFVTNELTPCGMFGTILFTIRVFGVLGIFIPISV
jgi:hypothetical protein